MSLIKNIESKMKACLTLAVASLITAIVISVISFAYASKMVTAERKQIYVLDKNVPLVAEHTSMANNRKAEYKSLIIQFHNLFFTLPPDDKYINQKLNSAMYLIDASGLAQYNTLKEKGYFNDLIATSTFVTCTTDSVVINMNTLQWTYYGKEKIQRPSDITIRSLITSGSIQNILNGNGSPLRTIDNPYGAILTNWKTIENKDISHEAKRQY